MSKTLKRILTAVVAVAVLVPGATFVYFHFISSDAPPPLTLSSSDTTATSAPSSSSPSTSDVVTGDVSGAWKPTTGSQVGYRVNEVAFGQSKTAVGRTSDVSGTLVINGSSVQSVEVVADMTTVASDQARRDNQFKGRIMNVAAYPTATFAVTKPFALPSVPTDASPITVPVTGQLTLHGTTKTVTVTLTAQRTGAHILVNGSIPVTFADYNIPNPSFGPVSTQDHGVLEFLVTFAKA